MLDMMRKLIIGLTKQGEEREQGKDIRRLAVGAAALARKPGKLVEQIKGLGEMEAFMDAETSTWIDAPEIAAGEEGAFDAGDLRNWLAIAERAGVASVPARVILSLSPAEAEVASGEIRLPDSPRINRIRDRIRAEVNGSDLDVEDAAAAIEQAERPDPEIVAEKLFLAMDELPEGWMCRSAQAGGSELKALAGCGLAGETAPEVRFGPGLEVGPGWVRVGNRRRVIADDKRTIQLYVQGKPGPLVFVGRPWVEAARYMEADDPHRHGSPFEGPGRWPAEWRAFVRGGEVVGVSFYYGWAGSPTPENARMALTVRDLARKMVDRMKADRHVPRFMSAEFARRRPEFAEILDANGFGRDDIACTLDFIETKDGIMLLEGGPGATPVGGGHSCAFAGCGGKPVIGHVPDTVGVAFRPMPHVLIGEMSTWEDGDRSGCVLGWDDAVRLAEEDR